MGQRRSPVHGVGGCGAGRLGDPHHRLQAATHHHHDDTPADHDDGTFDDPPDHHDDPPDHDDTGDDNHMGTDNNYLGRVDNLAAASYDDNTPGDNKHIEFDIDDGGVLHIVLDVAPTGVVITSPDTLDDTFYHRADLVRRLDDVHRANSTRHQPATRAAVDAARAALGLDTPNGDG